MSYQEYYKLVLTKLSEKTGLLLIDIIKTDIERTTVDWFIKLSYRHNISIFEVADELVTWFRNIESK